MMIKQKTIKCETCDFHTFKSSIEGGGGGLSRALLKSVNND